MKNLVLIAFIGFLVSCGSQQIKDTNMALLQNKKHIAGDIRMSGMFKSVNNKKLKVGAFTTPNQASHNVNSGSSLIYAYVTLSGKPFARVYAADFMFRTTLKAGQTYIIKPALKGSCIEIFLESSDGEKVGPYIEPWFDFDSPERIMSVMVLDPSKSTHEKCNS